MSQLQDSRLVLSKYDEPFWSVNVYWQKRATRILEIPSHSLQIQQTTTHHTVVEWILIIFWHIYETAGLDAEYIL